MADKLKDLVPRLGKRGPHRVLTGDLSYAGIPGRVYVPAEGKGVPGVAFGHDWRLGVEAYHSTLRHLASWGIAVAAPDTEKGMFPNHRGFASDLESALQILGGVRMGSGAVTVNPNYLFLAGHGMGAAAAVLAATGRRSRHNQSGYVSEPPLAGVMAVYPSDSSPSCYEAASHVDALGLVLDAGELTAVPAGDARRLAAQWKGDVLYRRLEKASPKSLHDKVLRRLVIGSGLPQYSQQELARALMTGFVLAETSDKYKKFRQPDAEVKNTTTATALELFANLPENKPAESAVDTLQSTLKRVRKL